MDGVHPPRCVEWRWCVLLLSCPVQWRGQCPAHPTAVLIGTAVLSCYCSWLGVWCVGGECLCVLFVWWGILCALPPRRGGGWGHRGWWGVVVGGGWHDDGRAAVLLIPRRMLASPVCVLASPVRLLGGRIEWREWRLCVAPCSDWVLPFTLSPSLYVVFTSLPFVCCCVCCGWGSAVVRGGRTVSRSAFLFPLQCVCCHSIVGLGVCLCGRVVSLWNSGDGLVCGVGVGLGLIVSPSSSSSSSCWCSGSARAALRART